MLSEGEPFNGWVRDERAEHAYLSSQQHPFVWACLALSVAVTFGPIYFKQLLPHWFVQLSTCIGTGGLLLSIGYMVVLGSRKAVRPDRANAENVATRRKRTTQARKSLTGSTKK